MFNMLTLDIIFIISKSSSIYPDDDSLTNITLLWCINSFTGTRPTTLQYYVCRGNFPFQLMECFLWVILNICHMMMHNYIYTCCPYLLKATTTPISSGTERVTEKDMLLVHFVNSTVGCVD